MENEWPSHEQLRSVFVHFSCEGFAPVALEHECANHATEGKRFSPPIHCCDVSKPPYLFSGEICTLPLYSKRLFVYTVCCRRGCSASLLSEHVIRRHSDVVGGSSGRSYVI